MSRPATNQDRRGNPIVRALRRSRAAFVSVGIFSGLINVLALTGAVYMLQVYDRVLPSHSVPTLVGLTVLMCGLYASYGLLDFVRGRLMSRIGLRLDRDVSDQIFRMVQSRAIEPQAFGSGCQPLHDLDALRKFFSGLGPTAIFDMPWIPVYLTVIYLLHPALGIFAVIGAILLVTIALCTEAASSSAMARVVQSAAIRNALAETARRNAEVICALGMRERMVQRWSRLNIRHVDEQNGIADAVSAFSSMGRILRLLLQSGILGLGAYLVIQSQVSSGTIIAGAITLSRALAPIEVAIAHWRGIVGARQSYDRLAQMFASDDADARNCIDLPPAHTSLSVSNLVVIPPQASRPALSNVDLALEAGDGLGVVGPSGSGKSTLARALVGVWQPADPTSSIRLDGATLGQWSPDQLGRAIGYVPQNIELFDGSIADNIARFDPAAKANDIIAAAEQAGCHNLITSLPDGYQTQIGEQGSRISGGQRQRIALARALYGDPFLVVLDEPNSNLDVAGELALTQAISSIRRRGGIAVVITHRRSILAGLNKMLVLSNGLPQKFGSVDEVLRSTVVPAVHPAQRSAARSPGAAGQRTTVVHLTGTSMSTDIDG